MRRRFLFLSAALGVILLLGGLKIRSLIYGPEGGAEGPAVEVNVPAGASFKEVVDTLDGYGLVRKPGLFRLYARVTGSDRQVRAGPYAFPRPTSWARLLRDLTEGRVLTETLTIPEGFTLKQMAPRIGAITGLPEDSVLTVLNEPSAEETWGVPGPGLEGYLFPDSYFLAEGVPVQEILAAMVSRYHAVWTPERVAARDALGMNEKEVVTLASIVQAEARLREEMPTIASVYHNRLARGHLLQADPTVLYALGGPRARLLYAAMDSVADHPYNTYTHVGLPPGPIGAPGLAAIEATLSPADTDYFYFVAHPDGSHIFSRTLSEHNRAVAESRRLWDRLRREQAQGQGNAPG
ncbi:MAG: endolytic transglycosylase MltG [Gemmatimonadota bacterium]|jgi:UPF0755 protein